MPDSGERLLATLVRAGATHLVGLPDNGTASLFECAGAHPEVELLTVSREGEAFAIASGLWLGGRMPVVVVQNTGLLESGDSLRGTAYRMGVPLLVLVSVRGQAKMEDHAVEIAAARARGQLGSTLQRADVDSVALLTEATLDAWSVPYRAYGGDEDATGVGELWAWGHRHLQPVALLLRRALTSPDDPASSAC